MSTCIVWTLRTRGVCVIHYLCAEPSDRSICFQRGHLPSKIQRGEMFHSVTPLQIIVCSIMNYKLKFFIIICCGTLWTLNFGLWGMLRMRTLKCFKVTYNCRAFNANLQAVDFARYFTALVLFIHLTAANVISLIGHHISLMISDRAR